MMKPPYKISMKKMKKYTTQIVWLAEVIIAIKMNQVIVIVKIRDLLFNTVIKGLVNLESIVQD